MSVTVLGGGIGGLSAAFFLLTRNSTSKIRLYEASSKVSGWINSEQHNGCYFESSARTLRPKGITGNTTLELIQLLGLENKIVPILSDRVSGKFRLTFAKNQFQSVTPEIDSDLKRLFSSDSTDAESIYDFTARKISEDFANEVIAPMVSGICAGDSKEISAKFLVKGKESETFESVELYKRARNERWSFYSLQGGLGTLPASIFENLSQNSGVSMNVNSKCEKIQFEADGTVKVTVNNEVHSTTHVISALPGEKLAPLIEHQHSELANELRQLKSYDSAMINLHFSSSDLLQHKGFGVFIPPSENSPILGIIFDSNIVDQKGTTLTVMMGGKGFEKHFGAEPEERKLLETSLSEVRRVLGIEEDPDKSKVNFMRKSFPQYTIGHYARVERIKAYIIEKKLPLSLCGQSFDGIGINEVILSAKKAASAV